MENLAHQFARQGFNFTFDYSVCFPVSRGTSLEDLPRHAYLPMLIETTVASVIRGKYCC